MSESTMVLTDPPAVVELKKQYRELDQRTETLKLAARAGHKSFIIGPGGQQKSELAIVERQKAAIAAEIIAVDMPKIGLPLILKALSDMIDDKDWEKAEHLAETIAQRARVLALESKTDEAGVVRK